MDNEIRLLDSSLLSDKKKLKEISYWLKVMNRPNGWHYDLDQIWILNELEKTGVLPGSTILDAGAGQGIMQYLLAARGYNVISLDFSSRAKPSHSLGIFNIEGEGDCNINYQHPFMRFISYDVNSPATIGNWFRTSNFERAPLLLGYAKRRATSLLFYIFERFVKRHDNYGTITFLRAPFHDVPLGPESVDAVISISAIEHADISLFHENINELSRLLKLRAPLLLTTSATTSDKNIYHEKTSGWCFSLSALKDFFSGCEIEFDAENCASSMIESEVFMDRLDPYYYQDKNSFCHKKYVKTFPYMPVAVKITK